MQRERNWLERGGAAGSTDSGAHESERKRESVGKKQRKNNARKNRETKVENCENKMDNMYDNEKEENEEMMGLRSPCCLIILLRLDCYWGILHKDSWHPRAG